MKKISIGPSRDLINCSGFEIEHERSWYMFARLSLNKERINVIVFFSILRKNETTIKPERVLATEKLPAGVPDLDSGLTDTQGNDLFH